ncbi:hypothetical protein EMIT0P258_120098 [Pseudomonas sp. IT-P258]
MLVTRIAGALADFYPLILPCPAIARIALPAKCLCVCASRMEERKDRSLRQLLQGNEVPVGAAAGCDLLL